MKWCGLLFMTKDSSMVTGAWWWLWVPSHETYNFTSQGVNLVHILCLRLRCNSNHTLAYSVASKTKRKTKGDFSFNICSKHTSINFLCFPYWKISTFRFSEKKMRRVDIQINNLIFPHSALQTGQSWGITSSHLFGRLVLAKRMPF